jgi:iron complex outermembrane recepter protein
MLQSNSRSWAALLIAWCIALLAAPALAQEKVRTFNIPAQALSSALIAYSKQSDVPVVASQTLVEGKRSAGVAGSYTPSDALKRLLAGTGLKAESQPSGGYTLAYADAAAADNGNLEEVTVTAKRDEAETSILVNQSSTSDRLGQSLRDQPKNTEIITAQLMADQQAQTVADALQNASGVVINNTNIQAGTNYTVRGYATAGIQNGLSGASNLAAGTTSSIANIERIEVLKGPDAILAGVDNLGGTVNVVTKKPSADDFINTSLELGSYESERLTADANGALTSDKYLSGRLIGTARYSDHNFGGYTGDKEYMVAPGLRFKNKDTDIILTSNYTRQITGATPYTMLNLENQRLPLSETSPIFGVKDQRVQVTSGQVFLEVDQNLTDWVKFVTRAQHQNIDLNINVLSPFGVLDDQGDVFADNSPTVQKTWTNAVDAFFRFQKTFFKIDNTLALGGTFSNLVTRYYTSDDSLTTSEPTNVLTNTPPIPPSPPADSYSNNFVAQQSGAYVQYLGKWGPVHLSGGVRENYYKNYAEIADGTLFNPVSKDWSASPNVGLVYDIIPQVGLFASLARGVTPNFETTYQGAILPNDITKNVEAGAKIELAKRLFLTASWFKLSESNVPMSDPIHQGFAIPGPGQRGQGLDMSVTGEILPQWNIQASYTNTDYSYLAPTGFGDIVAAEPRQQYSLYSNITRPIRTDWSWGTGAGLFGRTKASIDSMGSYYVPANFQVNWNGFMHYGPWDANIGVRNVFNHTNYGITVATSYLPYLERRNWRLTLTRHFQ